VCKIEFGKYTKIAYNFKDMNWFSLAHKKSEKWKKYINWLTSILKISKFRNKLENKAN